ncbi:uncharacterized protein LOC130970802 [Arachis stenosperma]|uniref:uncharacterized protein LOC130970802 n=1 Tax=Arachis stenosperma TaxID=217475 RepID=UPI0025ACBAA8|nr:uncharacterized protein LOC130970802 [Arachis stenosperma]
MYVCMEMGNGGSSCNRKKKEVFKVLLVDDGRVEAYRKAMRAGELMVEYPGHFVCDSGYLKVGHRIQGLLAHQELQGRKFYFLLPMDLLYSVLTHDELSSFNYKASRSRPTLNNFANTIFSHFFVCLCPPRPEKLRSLADAGAETDETYSKLRSWRPALETINESPSRA